MTKNSNNTHLELPLLKLTIERAKSDNLNSKNIVVEMAETRVKIARDELSRDEVFDYVETLRFLANYLSLSGDLSIGFAYNNEHRQMASYYQKKYVDKKTVNIEDLVATLTIVVESNQKLIKSCIETQSISDEILKSFMDSFMKMANKVNKNEVP